MEAAIIVTQVCDTPRLIYVSKMFVGVVGVLVDIIAVWILSLY